MSALAYADARPVEQGDHVCVGAFDAGVEGVVMALFPKSGRAMVRFPEWMGRTASSIPVSRLSLLRRSDDGSVGG